MASTTSAQQSVGGNGLQGYSTIDSLSYAIGVLQSQGLSEYASEQMNVDMKYLDDFIKGLKEGSHINVGTAEHAKAVGLYLGQQVGQNMVTMVNKEVFGTDSTKSVSLDMLMSAMSDVLKGQEKISTETASSYADTKMRELKMESLLAKYGDNKKASDEFIRKIAKKRGVKKLEDGVMYKVLKAGKGAIPTDSSTVKVHYEGRTVDGNVFDSSYERNEPATFEVGQVIRGWSIALTHMPVGSTWEIYIPQEQAYGEREAGEEIKPFSALIFKVELLEIDPEESEEEDEIELDEVEKAEE
ncbi:MAG: FKBP-type peptidyl-prolyl cis-trans isomerase [Prevotella sp.]|nr:FKBP-type peptidyl-prolyl cis-trans isomerase [Prevotella sp.]